MYRSALLRKTKLIHLLPLVLATGPGNPAAVRVWPAKTGRFSSRPVQKPDHLSLGGLNPDPYLSTPRLCRVWLDPSVPMSGSAFRVFYLWSHSDILLLIAKYWLRYIIDYVRCIDCLCTQKEERHPSSPNLKLRVNRASMILGLVSQGIIMWFGHCYP